MSQVKAAWLLVFVDLFLILLSIARLRTRPYFIHPVILAKGDRPESALT